MSEYNYFRAVKIFKKIESRYFYTIGSTEKERFKVFGVEFVYLYLVGIIIANIGWIAENAVKLISSGVIDSRFHLLPFISPYALVPIAMHVFLKDTDDICIFGKKVFNKKSKSTVIYSNILSLLLVCGAVFIGEFFVGNLWEKLFGVKLWNYSAQPLHLTQYVSLFSALGYGVGAFLLFKYMIRPMIASIEKIIDFATAKKLCMTLGVWILADTFTMFLQILILGKAPVYWMLTL